MNTNTTDTNTKETVTITLTVELPTRIEVSPSTGGKQMKAVVVMDYPCTDTLKRFLLFDLKRRAENMVRQDNASQSVYGCSVSGGKLQRIGKPLAIEEAKMQERLQAVEALVASGMDRKQAIKILGYDGLVE